MSRIAPILESHDELEHTDDLTDRTPPTITDGSLVVDASASSPRGVPAVFSLGGPLAPAAALTAAVSSTAGSSVTVHLDPRRVALLTALQTAEPTQPSTDLFAFLPPSVALTGHAGGGWLHDLRLECRSRIQMLVELETHALKAAEQAQKLAAVADATHKHRLHAMALRRAREESTTKSGGSGGNTTRRSARSVDIGSHFTSRDLLTQIIESDESSHSSAANTRRASSTPGSTSRSTVPTKISMNSSALTLPANLQATRAQLLHDLTLFNELVDTSAAIESATAAHELQFRRQMVDRQRAYLNQRLLAQKVGAIAERERQRGVTQWKAMESEARALNRAAERESTARARRYLVGMAVARRCGDAAREKQLGVEYLASKKLAHESAKNRFLVYTSSDLPLPAQKHQERIERYVEKQRLAAGVTGTGVETVTQEPTPALMAELEYINEHLPPGSHISRNALAEAATHAAISGTIGIIRPREPLYDPTPQRAEWDDDLSSDSALLHRRSKSPLKHTSPLAVLEERRNAASPTRPKMMPTNSLIDPTAVFTSATSSQSRLNLRAPLTKFERMQVTIERDLAPPPPQQQQQPHKRSMSQRRSTEEKDDAEGSAESSPRARASPTHAPAAAPFGGGIHRMTARELLHRLNPDASGAGTDYAMKRLDELVRLGDVTADDLARLGPPPPPLTVAVPQAVATDAEAGFMPPLSPASPTASSMPPTPMAKDAPMSPPGHTRTGSVHLTMRTPGSPEPVATILPLTRRSPSPWTPPFTPTLSLDKTVRFLSHSLSAEELVSRSTTALLRTLNGIPELQTSAPFLPGDDDADNTPNEISLPTSPFTPIAAAPSPDAIRAISTGESISPQCKTRLLTALNRVIDIHDETVPSMVRLNDANGAQSSPLAHMSNIALATHFLDLYAAERDAPPKQITVKAPNGKEATRIETPSERQARLQRCTVELERQIKQEGIQRQRMKRHAELLGKQTSRSRHIDFDSDDAADPDAAEEDELEPISLDHLSESGPRSLHLTVEDAAGVGHSPSNKPSPLHKSPSSLLSPSHRLPSIGEARRTLTKAMAKSASSPVIGTMSPMQMRDSPHRRGKGMGQDHLSPSGPQTPEGTAQKQMDKSPMRGATKKPTGRLSPVRQQPSSPASTLPTIPTPSSRNSSASAASNRLVSSKLYLSPVGGGPQPIIVAPTKDGSDYISPTFTFTPSFHADGSFSPQFDPTRYARVRQAALRRHQVAQMVGISDEMRQQILHEMEAEDTTDNQTESDPRQHAHESDSKEAGHDEAPTPAQPSQPSTPSDEPTVPPRPLEQNSPPAVHRMMDHRSLPTTPGDGADRPSATRAVLSASASAPVLPFGLHRTSTPSSPTMLSPKRLTQVGVTFDPAAFTAYDPVVRAGTGGIAAAFPHNQSLHTGNVNSHAGPSANEVTQQQEETRLRSIVRRRRKESAARRWANDHALLMQAGGEGAPSGIKEVDPLVSNVLRDLRRAQVESKMGFHTASPSSTTNTAAVTAAAMTPARTRDATAMVTLPAIGGASSSTRHANQIASAAAISALIPFASPDWSARTVARRAVLTEHDLAGATPTYALTNWYSKHGKSSLSATGTAMDPKLSQKYHECFGAIDEAHEGEITAEDIHAALKKTHGLSLSLEEVESLLRKLKLDQRNSAATSALAAATTLARGKQSKLGHIGHHTFVRALSGAHEWEALLDLWHERKAAAAKAQATRPTASNATSTHQAPPLLPFILWIPAFHRLQLIEAAMSFRLSAAPPSTGSLRSELFARQKEAAIEARFERLLREMRMPTGASLNELWRATMKQVRKEMREAAGEQEKKKPSEKKTFSFEAAAMRGTIDEEAGVHDDDDDDDEEDIYQASTDVRDLEREYLAGVLGDEGSAILRQASIAQRRAARANATPVHAQPPASPSISSDDAAASKPSLLVSTDTADDDSTLPLPVLSPTTQAILSPFAAKNIEPVTLFGAMSKIRFQTAVHDSVYAAAAAARAEERVAAAALEEAAEQAQRSRLAEARRLSLVDKEEQLFEATLARARSSAANTRPNSSRRSTAPSSAASRRRRAGAGITYADDEFDIFIVLTFIVPRAATDPLVGAPRGVLLLPPPGAIHLPLPPVDSADTDLLVATCAWRDDVMRANARDLEHAQHEAQEDQEEEERATTKVLQFG